MTKLLLIEDDKRQAEMLATFLASCGMDLHACHTAADGVRTLKSGQFDALLLDLMLPDGDGIEICQRVRTFSPIPIIMLTAKGEETDRIVGLEVGADDYLPKPYSPRELLARIKAVLRRSQNTSKVSEIEVFGRLEISPDERIARLDGNDLTLTGYQFDILTALCAQAGKIVSREALMNALKGHDLNAFDRSIDVHVSRIRAQIEDDPKNPRRIITVRGAGYLFARIQA